MKELIALVALVRKLPPGTIAHLIDFVGRVLTSRDPKAALIRAAEEEARVQAFDKMQRATHKR